MAGPQVTIDLGKIERNARLVVDRCAASGIGVFGVTKGTCGIVISMGAPASSQSIPLWT